MKGSTGRIVGIIIVAVAILLISGLWGRLLGIISEDWERNACFLSVQLQAELPAPVKGDQSLNCDTYYVTFHDDHVARGTSPLEQKDYKTTIGETKIGTYNTLTDDIVYTVIADELLKCWQQFHSGDVKVFREERFDQGDDNTVCYICDEVSFADDVRPQTFGTPPSHGDDSSEAFTDDFYGFLRATKAIDDQTYYDLIIDDERICNDFYLNGPSNCWHRYAAGYDDILGFIGPERAPIDMNIAFTTGQKYAIFFVREGTQWRGEQLYGTTPTFFSYIIPSYQLAEQCDTYAT